MTTLNTNVDARHFHSWHPLGVSDQIQNLQCEATMCPVGPFMRIFHFINHSRNRKKDLVSCPIKG